jgi:hypothetical protein
VATLLEAAAKDPTLPIDNLSNLAVARLKAGDAAGYRAACAAIAGRMPPPGTPLLLGDAVAATGAFVLGPGAADDWAVPLAWADRVLTRLAEREAADPALKERSKSLWHLFQHARGALLFRAGRFEEAAKSLRDGMSFHPAGGEFGDWAFVALVEHRLGHAAAATEAAAKARAARATSKSDAAWGRAGAELLVSELAAALPPPRQ